MSMPTVQEPLPIVRRTITTEALRRYAAASGDFNPIHLDPEVAAASDFGGIVAHGMLVLASITEALDQAFPWDWASSGELTVRFRAPVRLGETATAGGVVKAVDELPDGSYAVRCDVWCTTGGDETAISGEAKLRYRDR